MSKHMLAIYSIAALLVFGAIGCDDDKNSNVVSEYCDEEGSCVCSGIDCNMNCGGIPSCDMTCSGGDEIAGFRGIVDVKTSDAGEERCLRIAHPGVHNL